MVKVEDLKPKDHIVIEWDGTRLKSAVVVDTVNHGICLNHVHINNTCYDRGTEVGLYAPEIPAE